MCYTEDSLEITPPTDHEKRKKLYEKLGDGACLLKRYTKAIEYYKKMLQEAELNGNTGKELVPCYISLAQTYKDNCEYNMAIEFFRKEFNVNKDDVKESVETLLNIAEVMELAGYDIDEINTIYVQIRQKCQLCKAKRFENKTIKRHADFLRCKNKTDEANKLEGELSDYTPSDEEGADTEGANVADIGEELNLSDITDVSDDDEEGSVRSTPQKTTRTRTMKLTRNVKGETQLHTACIKGNVGLVKSLLEQGHPVNVRDNCGWLPIHEACSYGNLEIVKMLVKYKADINDRGGKLCFGITPLHDACTNGHLEVIHYLLNRGASIIAKTDDTGQTPLHFLKQWHENTAPLTPDQQQLYNGILQQMQASLERFGQKIDKPPVLSTCSAYQDEEKEAMGLVGTRRRSVMSSTPSPSPRKRAQKSPKKSVGRIGEARRRICDDDDDDDDDEDGVRGKEEKRDSVAEEATNEYKQAIENLRRHSTTLSIEKKRKSDELKKSPYVENNDDWLEDDLGNAGTAKRRKSSTVASLLHTSNTRKSPEFGVETLIEISSDDSGEGFIAKPKSKRKTQVSLINVGFSRSKTSPTKKKRSPMKMPLEERVKLTEADSSSATGVEQLNRVKQMQMLSVDVRIEEKLYRVPVPAVEVHNCTIKWLAEEAAKRYFKREGIKPSLELETKNGAILADEDLVSMLFPAGSVQAEELKATVTKRSLPPLVDRYEEACHQTNTIAREDLKDILRQTSTVLDLSDLALRGNVLTPLCKAINRQENLVELNLSGNLVKDECFQLLCTTLPSLTNLATLNLSLNNLTADSLKNLSDCFTNSSRPILEKLTNLNLSYNPIGDEGYGHLAAITRHLRLKCLNLASVDFTEKLFEGCHNKNVELNLATVEVFDVCHNRLDKSGILKFVTWLNPRTLEEFDVSGNRVTEQFLLREMLEIFRGKGVDTLILRKLGLAGCLVGDSESFDLLQMLQSCALNLSNNRHLTWLSLRRLLLHRPPLLHLDVYNCDNIFKYSDTPDDNYLKLPQDSIKSFVVSQNNDECLELLTKVWRERYKDKAGVINEMKIVRFFVS